MIVIIIFIIARQAGPSSKKRSCSLHGKLDPRPTNDPAYARQLGTSSDRRCVYGCVLTLMPTRKKKDWLRANAYKPSINKKKRGLT